LPVFILSLFSVPAIVTIAGTLNKERMNTGNTIAGTLNKERMNTSNTIAGTLNARS
jgi:hypothetical protein